MGYVASGCGHTCCCCCCCCCLFTDLSQ
jgi:hypothetical protein